MILFYITETIKSIKSAKLAAIITIITSVFAILMFYLAFLLFLYTDIIENKLYKELRVEVFLEEDLQGATRIDFLNEVKMYEIVSSVKYVSKSQARDKFVSQTGKDFSEILDFNPLPASFEISIRNVKGIEQKLKSLTDDLKSKSIVSDVKYDYSLLSSIIKIVNSSKKIIYGLSFILFVFSIYLIYSTNKIIIESQMQDYKTMKLVGARPISIKIPVILRGLLLGLISALVSYFLFFMILYLLSDRLIVREIIIFVKSIKLFNLHILITGIFFGLAGSFFSSSNISQKIKEF